MDRHATTVGSGTVGARKGTVDVVRLTDLLALSHVPRWTVVDCSRTQTVADHTFRVIVILDELARRIGVTQLAVSDVWHALIHDAAESRTGDVSGRFKEELAVRGDWKKAEHRMSPWLSEDQGMERAATKGLLKLADLVETITFVKRYGVGPHAERVANRICAQLYLHANKHGFDSTVVHSVIDDILSDTGR